MRAIKFKMFGKILHCISDRGAHLDSGDWQNYVETGLSCDKLG